MSDNVSKKVTSNLIWRLLERFGSQGVTLVVSIVLARILDPSVYGIVAIVTVFTTILQVFVDSGLGNALIQKKKPDDVDYSSVFFFNITLCLVLYALLFLTAPLIASFYEMPELTPIVRVVGLTLIISGLKNIQQAYVSKNMLFKRFFFATLGGTIGAAIVGVLLAYRGYGVWALVIQNLFNQFVDTAILWITVKWRPKRLFSFDRLKKLFSFGSKLLLSSLLTTLYNDIRQLIIGKKYSSDTLAYYNRGGMIPNLFVTNINVSIDSVLLPTLSEVQDNTIRLRSMTRRAIKTSTYIILPIMMGLIGCSEALVRLVLTEKWLPSVFFVRVFCVVNAFYPIHTANRNAIKSLGKSNYILIIGIMDKIIGIIAILATVWISVEAMAVSVLVSSVTGHILNAWPNRKLIRYGFLDQLIDIFPNLVLSVCMGGIVYCVSFFGLRDIFTLLIQVPVGVIVYICGSKLFHIDSFFYCVQIARSYLNITN